MITVEEAYIWDIKIEKNTIFRDIENIVTLKCPPFSTGVLSHGRFKFPYGL